MDRRSPTRSLLWLAATLTVLAAPPAFAQWKWKDAQGRVTVSDLPPPRSVPDKDILQRPEAQRRAATAAAAEAASAAGTAGASPAAAASSPVDKDLEAKKRAAEQERAAKAKAEEDKLSAQRAENCRRARQHLAALDSGQRIVRMNDKGEREFIDDAQRANESRRARDVIASECR
ncbi:MAG: DUF4124 domain-containing protein [Rubrivivax sp.]|jgi:hypothetical protein|nr:DUF4124 domain-containing protein [Rubrivivax sp.]